METGYPLLVHQPHPLLRWRIGDGRELDRWTSTCDGESGHLDPSRGKQRDGEIRVKGWLWGSNGAHHRDD